MIKNRTYENLRQLAIYDAKRRLQNVAEKIPEWDIVDRVHKNGDIEKQFTYHPTIGMMLGMDFNTYAQVREIKYIVWRFEITREELGGGMSAADINGGASPE
jgi:ASC-1-like (ASCH) protein